MVATTRNARKSPPIGALDTDRRPGSIDVEWAEQAYRHRGVPRSRMGARPSMARMRQALRTLRMPAVRRVRLGLRAMVGAMVIVLAAVGLAVAMTTPVSSPAVAGHRSPARSAAVAAPPGGTSAHPVLTAPLQHPLPILLPPVPVAQR